MFHTQMSSQVDISSVKIQEQPKGSWASRIPYCMNVLAYAAHIHIAELKKRAMYTTVLITLYPMALILPDWYNL